MKTLMMVRVKRKRVGPVGHVSHIEMREKKKVLESFSVLFDFQYTFHVT